MPFRATLGVLLLAISSASAAEVSTLAGKKFVGELTGIDARQVVIKTSSTEEKIPIDQVLDVVLEKVRTPKDAKYALIEMVDGSQFLCSKAELKGKQIKLVLLGGQEFSADVNHVKYILNDAQDPEIAKQWREVVLSQKHTMDVVATMRKGQLNPIDGTLGEADALGKNIQFTLVDGQTTMQISLTKPQGLLFVRGPAANALPLRCKVYDTMGDVLMVSEVAKDGDHFTLTTSLAIKLDYTASSLARLDYNRGKLVFLSDMKPIKEQHSTTEGYPFHYRLDLNLDGKPLQMGGRPYPKGLAIHARTDLEYDLAGEFRELKMDIGFDYQVGGSDGPVVLVVEGDGKELKSWTLDRAADREPRRDETVNVKDVQRLKLVVKSGSLLDLGKHLNLGNAQVSK